MTGDVWYAARRIPSGSGLDQFAVIPNARPISIPGWEHLDLCVHRTLYFSAMANHVLETLRDGAYSITEGTTGALLAHGLTEEDAIAVVTTVLNRHGRKAVQRRIARWRKKYGPSPRVAGIPG